MKRLLDMTEPELREYFGMLGHLIESVLPGEAVPGGGHNGRALFVLVVFDDPAVGQYLSNCNRHNMVKALRETADRLENNEVLPR